MRGAGFERVCFHELLCLAGRAKVRGWRRKWTQECRELFGLQFEEPRLLLLPGQMLWQLLLNEDSPLIEMRLLFSVFVITPTEKKNEICLICIFGWCNYIR